MKFAQVAVVIGFALVLGAQSHATDIFVAQNATGSNSGADCNNAHSASWFNSSANWGSGAAQIGPGTVVHLCGVFTASANGNLLYVQASGTASNYITIRFEPGAILQAPYFSDNGAIYMSGKSFIRVDGGTNGIIQNTANGTTLGNQAYVSSGMFVGNGNYIEIMNLTCQNIYVRTSGTDHNMGGGPSQNNCVHFDGGSNISIHDNVLHDAGWTIWYGAQSGTASNFSAYNNEIYHTDHGIGFGEGGATGKTVSGIKIYNNHFHDPVNWDDTASSVDSQWYHHDGIHIFFYCSGGSYCAETSSSNVNIYNNLFDGDWGIGLTGFVFTEGQMTGLNFYNNVGISNTGRYANNGLFNIWAINLQVYNNTIVGGSTSAGYCIIPGSLGGTSSVKNNVISGCQGLISPQSGAYSGGWDNNVYGSGGNQMFQWHNGSGTTDIGTWRSQCGCDTNSKVSTSLGLDPTGRPSSGSAVTGAGANLATVGIAPLTADRLGAVRPASGGWDAGAYNVGAGASAPPAPPTNLQAVPH